MRGGDDGGVHYTRRMQITRIFNRPFRYVCVYIYVYVYVYTWTSIRGPD